MFTGIIESTGTITKIEKEGTNVHFTVKSPITNELKIDQSLAHDGVCLTVVVIEGDEYVVTAIDETLIRSAIGDRKVGDELNLERAMISNGRLDGHIVQGHVDATGTCVGKENKDGSWIFTFEYTLTPEHLLVDKGSVCINGVSLTVVSPVENRFSVAIIPYTYEHTSFKHIEIGSKINLEFDIIGKYMAKYMQVYAK
ncbi:MAG: riboflavin synthase [Saprospiraceae bacterium]|nr:riboflavin synthase [Saprospiraceae bacterium]